MRLTNPEPRRLGPCRHVAGCSSERVKTGQNLTCCLRPTGQCNVEGKIFSAVQSRRGRDGTRTGAAAAAHEDSCKKKPKSLSRLFRLSGPLRSPIYSFAHVVPRADWLIRGDSDASGPLVDLHHSLVWVVWVVWVVLGESQEPETTMSG